MTPPPPPLTDRREMLALGIGAALLPLAATRPADAAAPDARAGRFGRAMPFDADWRFRRGVATGQEDPALDDAGWRRIDLPHDWSIEDVPGGTPPHALGPFTQGSAGGVATGFTEGGEGWYRKRFRVDPYPVDAQIEIAFGAASLEAEVWLNGRPLGGNVHGYIPFAFDLTPHLDRHGDNLLAVRVRNLGRNSRWYAGSGLYRPVTLDVLPATTRIARHGIAVATRRIDGGIAQIGVDTTMEAVAPGHVLVTRMIDDAGRVVAEARADVAGTVTQELAVRGPHLWSLEQPYLYRLETTVMRGDTAVDRMIQTFGVRIIAFDPVRGMTLNGRPLRLRGGSLHHDNGLLGACAFADADDRRVRLLKARGYNAIRSAHNPASSTLRDACDRIGMMLIEEAFDTWHVAKEPQDFSTHFADRWEEVIRAMVLQARNSPAVMMWSIGNEIPYRNTDEGVAWQWRLADAVKRLDRTRPVTAGLNGVLGAPLVAGAESARPGRGGRPDSASTVFLDVPGYNYRLEDIEPEHADHPERVVYASETFAREMVDYQALADRAPYFLGEFVWTAMDYLGEAGIGATARLRKGEKPYFIPGWPWVNAWCGDIDLIGRQKASSLARDVVWGISPLEMTVQRPVEAGMFEYVANWGWPDELQSWSWPDHVGHPVSVRLYCAGDRVELRLDGAVIGTRTLTDADRMRAEFQLPYAPGILEAVAWRGGVAIGRRRLETVGPASRLRLVAEPAAGHERRNLRFVVVEVLDAHDRVLPDDAREITIRIDGPADLAAFGSAAPLATGSFRSPTTRSHRGRALAILCARGLPGAVRIVASADGLTGAATTIRLD